MGAGRGEGAQGLTHKIHPLPSKILSRQRWDIHS